MSEPRTPDDSSILRFRGIDTFSGVRPGNLFISCQAGILLISRGRGTLESILFLGGGNFCRFLAGRAQWNLYFSGEGGNLFDFCQRHRKETFLYFLGLYFLESILFLKVRELSAGVAGLLISVYFLPSSRSLLLNSSSSLPFPCPIHFSCHPPFLLNISTFHAP